MAINSISSLTPMTPTTGGSSVGGGAKASGDGFGSMMKDMVESIDQSQKSAETEIAKAVTGESPDIHKTIIALQSADLKFQLGLQVRNKLLGAYEEIMRMQV
jgi:flagellar hook-basal body complex protein FliE